MTRAIPHWLKTKLIATHPTTLYPGDTIRTSMYAKEPEKLAKLLRGESVVVTHNGSLAEKGQVLHKHLFANAPYPELYMRRAIEGTGKYLTGHCDSFDPPMGAIHDLKSSDKNGGLDAITDEERHAWTKQLCLYAMMLMDGEVWVSEQDGVFYQVSDDDPRGQWVSTKKVFGDVVVRSVEIIRWDSDVLAPGAHLLEGAVLQEMMRVVWDAMRADVIAMMAGMWEAPKNAKSAVDVPEALVSAPDEELFQKYVALEKAVKEFEAVKTLVKQRMKPGTKVPAAGKVFSLTKPTVGRELSDDWQKRVDVSRYQKVVSYTTIDMDAVRRDLENDATAWIEVPKSSPSLRVSEAK